MNNTGKHKGAYVLCQCNKAQLTVGTALDLLTSQVVIVHQLETWLRPIDLIPQQHPNNHLYITTGGSPSIGMRSLDPIMKGMRKRTGRSERIM